MTYRGSLELIRKGNFQLDIYEAAFSGIGKAYSSQHFLAALQTGSEALREQIMPWMDEPGMKEFLRNFGRIRRAAKSGRIPAPEEVKACFPNEGKLGEYEQDAMTAEGIRI